jgi:diaminopropionate ammonia-lyase
MRLLSNRADLGSRSATAPGATAPPDTLAFHTKLPGYATTPLVALPNLAARLGLGALWVKDESSRLGLPSFKILGASWATYRAIEQRLGHSLPAWSSVAELAGLVGAELGKLRLAAATDGNHGRAVARMARWLGWDAAIFVPEGTVAARIAAIESEGATVTVVNGTYDDAVRRSAEEAGPGCLVISDTSWPGYTEPPRHVIEGYATICLEVEHQLAERGAAPPDVVVVQIGVGALAAATVRHWRDASPAPARRIIGVEPDSAACALASVEAGRIVAVPGPHRSIMAGLNCDTPSLVAWPEVSRGIDAFLAIDDTAVPPAMRALARAGVVSGETGAAGLAGLMELCAQADGELRARLRLTGASSVLVVSTEGATDPAAYQSILASAQMADGGL